MQPTKSHAIAPLTGLRFIAALLVFTSHASSHLVPATSILYNFLARISAEGMTLFFVLSGFVIHYNYANSILHSPKAGIYQFFVARFARLVPLYAVCVLVDILLSTRYSANFSGLHMRYLLLDIMPYYLTLTQSWFYHIVGHTSLIYPMGWMMQLTWSISTEWFFYLTYPAVCFAILLLRSVRSKLLMMLNITLAALIVVFLLVTNLNTINQAAVQHYGQIADFNTSSQNSFFRWLIYFSPYSRIAEFLLGCLVAAIYMQLQTIKPVASRNQSKGLMLTLAALLLVAISHYYIWYPPDLAALQWLPFLHRTFGFAPAFAAVIFCCAYYNNIITKLLSLRVILFGGELSYSIYLVHLLIIDQMIHGKIHYIFDALPIWFKFVTIFTIVLAASSLTYRFIEMPARRAIRKMYITRKRELQVSTV